jgi:hypothetical protein
MTLTIITKTGKRRVFPITYAFQVKNILRIIQEPIAGYTLIRNDKSEETTWIQ